MNEEKKINDLCDDELEIIFKSLSIRQQLGLQRVCKRWKIIVSRLMERQKVVTSIFNDINIFSHEDERKFCSCIKHRPINASIGRIMGKGFMFTIEFSLFKNKLMSIINKCPNIESIHLPQISVKPADVELILSHCPRLECLSISTNEKLWGNSLINLGSGSHLKHLCITTTSRSQLHGGGGSMFFTQLPQLEELVIDGILMNSMSQDQLCASLRLWSNQLNRFHFCPLDYNKNQDPFILNIIDSLSGNELSKSHIKDLKLDVPSSYEMLDSINCKLTSLEVLHLRLGSNPMHIMGSSLKNLKNLIEINLDFNSIIDTEMNQDIFFSQLLKIMPSSIRRLFISNAMISMDAFKEIPIDFPQLQQLDLSHVSLALNGDTNFWKVISTLKSLRRLIINFSDIRDEGCEHLLNCELLEMLELMKYKGIAAEKWISSEAIISAFAALAIRHPLKWVTLRLDVDVIEITHDIRKSVPRNMKLLNVGWKK